MFKIIFIFLLLIQSSFAIDFSTCSNHNSDSATVITDDFIYCVERNFALVQHKLGLTRRDLPICRIYNDTIIDMLYIDCLNANISVIAQVLQNRMSYCPNYSTEHLTSSFISCINYKFEIISKVIPQFTK